MDLLSGTYTLGATIFIISHIINQLKNSNINLINPKQISDSDESVKPLKYMKNISESSEMPNLKFKHQKKPINRKKSESSVDFSSVNKLKHLNVDDKISRIKKQLKHLNNMKFSDDHHSASSSASVSEDKCACSKCVKTEHSDSYHYSEYNQSYDSDHNTPSPHNSDNNCNNCGDDSECIDIGNGNCDNCLDCPEELHITEEVSTFKDIILAKVSVIIKCYKDKLAMCNSEKSLLIDKLTKCCADKKELKIVVCDLKAKLKQCEQEKCDALKRVKQLEKELAELLAKYNDLETKHNKCKQELCDLKKESKCDKDKIKELEHKIKDLEGELKKCKKDKEQLLCTVNKLKEDFAKCKKEKYELKQKLDDCEEKVKSQEHVIKKLNKCIDELTDQIKELMNKINDLIHQNAHLNNENKELKLELSHALKSLDYMCEKYKKLKKDCHNKC
jgi:cell division septum initiation protein DivIVA